MVGFDPNEKQPLPNICYGAAGALSGVVTRGVAQPLDVLKIRFQLQVEPIKKHSKQELHFRSKYTGIFQACGTICREEGLAAFWKGHVPAQALSITYGVVQFTAFEVLSKKVHQVLPPANYNDIRPICTFVCGGLSGILATLAAQPFDVIRTRFVAQGEPKIYSSLVHAAGVMLKHEGFTSLYKGLSPTLVQIAPYAGFQFGFYSIFSGIWQNLQNSDDSAKIGPIPSLVCGSLSGLCSKTAVYPLDLAKKRLQVQGFEKARGNFGRTQKYTGLINCFRTIWLTEGAVGFYKGLSPSAFKAVVTTAISFCVYEEFIMLFKYGYYR